MGMRNDEQLPTINLAPTAHIAVSQLREVNRPLILVFPFHATDLSLARINLHQRTWANDRKKGEILKADVAVHGLAQVEVLQQTDRNLVPFLYDSCQQIRSLEPKARFEFNGERDIFSLWVFRATQEMRSWQADRCTVSIEVSDLQSKLGRHFRKSSTIDY